MFNVMPRLCVSDPYTVTSSPNREPTFPRSDYRRAILFLPLITLFSTAFFTFTDSSWDGGDFAGYRSEFVIGCWPAFARYNQFLWSSNSPVIVKPSYPRGFSIDPLMLVFAVVGHYFLAVAFCNIARRLLNTVQSTTHLYVTTAMSIVTGGTALSVRFLPNFDDLPAAVGVVVLVVPVTAALISSIAKKYSAASLISLLFVLSYFWLHRVYLIYWQVTEDYASVGNVDVDDGIAIFLFFMFTLLGSFAATAVAKRAHNKMMQRSCGPPAN